MDAKTDYKLLDDVSLARRQLLRAAASVAPLIATLPSGAALAQASASNCVIEEQQAAESGLDQPEAITASKDKYVRVKGTRRKYTFARTSIHFDNINDSETAEAKEVYEFVVPGTRRNVSVDEQGNWVDLSGATPSGGPVDQFFLVIYKPIGFEGKVTELCDLENQVHFWPEGAPQPSPPDYCIAPLAKVSTNQPDNIALDGSCVASLALRPRG